MLKHCFLSYFCFSLCIQILRVFSVTCNLKKCAPHYFRSLDQPLKTGVIITDAQKEESNLSKAPFLQISFLFGTKCLVNGKRCLCLLLLNFFKQYIHCIIYTIENAKCNITDIQGVRTFLLSSRITIPKSVFGPQMKSSSEVALIQAIVSLKTLRTFCIRLFSYKQTSYIYKQQIQY